MSQGAPPENKYDWRYKDYRRETIYLPLLITTGVSKVKIAVDKIPNPSVYFPPNFSDRIPPGMCVITWN